MIRLDYFLFGYVRFKISDADVLKAVKLLKKHSVSVKIDGSGEFCVSVFKSGRVAQLLDTRVEFCKSEICGMGGFIYKNRKRYGVFCALIFLIALGALSSLLVWDVRIEGVEGEDAECVVRELSDCGFGVGSLWSRVDKSVLERDLLESSDTVGWVNVNRRGTVAYVRVLKKNYREKEEKNDGYSNVVAAFDGVVEEITVKKGVAAVQVGDSVRKGELLISGVLPKEQGGGFCYAEGTVYLRVSEEISVNVKSYEERKKFLDTSASDISISFFNFCAKIFKSSRNFGDMCDIIEETRDITIGNKKLPISLSVRRASVYTIETAALTSDEMTAEASKLLRQKLSESLTDATLLRIRTLGKFTDEGYTMHASLVVLRDAATNLGFKKT